MKKEKSSPTTAVANPAVRITGAVATAVAPKAALVRAPVATVAVPTPKNPPIAALDREFPKVVVLTVMVVVIGYGGCDYCACSQ